MRALMLFLLPLLTLSGCANVCDRMCAVEASTFDRCLPDWDLTWEEAGYPGGAAEQEERCSAVSGDAYEASESGSATRTALGQECLRRLQAAQGDTDCQTLLGS